MERFRRNVLTGLLTIVPLWITVWVMWFVLDQVIRLGRPLVLALSRALRPETEEIADLLASGWFQSLLAVAIVVALLAAVGAATNAVLGRRLIRSLDRFMKRVPLAKTVYGATRTLIDSLQGGPTGAQRVVLIEFPTPEMRAVGFVTATFTASDTGEELAAVYVPTTPNPTSGYLEIVPTKRLVWLDWSANEAMSFIVSGGAMTPAGIRMNPQSPSGPAVVPSRGTAAGETFAALDAADPKGGGGGS
jgi:uncharacterized membrane protein